MKTFIVLFNLVFLATGCLVKYGNMQSSSFVATADSSYTNISGRVELFFEGVIPEKEYEQIGYVEATGNSVSSNEEVLNFLRYEAYKNGADAVINVKKQFKGREEGYLFDDENVQYYDATVFGGTAIRYIENTVLAEPVSEKDLNFVKYVENVNSKNEKEVSNQVFISVFIGILSIIAVLIKNN